MLQEVQSSCAEPLSVICYTWEHISTSQPQPPNMTDVQRFYTKLSSLYSSLVSCTPSRWTGFDSDYVTATCHLSRMTLRVSVTSSFLLPLALHRVSAYVSINK